jgi:5-methylcytosine-specific restriction endonuclease McrA
VKVCTKCECSKEESQFYKNKRFGLTHWCKYCFKQSEQIRKQVNPLEFKARASDRAMNTYYRYHEAYKEKLRNRAKTTESKAYVKSWRQTPKGKAVVARMNAKRHELTKNDSPLSWTDIQFLVELQHNECIGCARTFSNELPYTLDHIHPLSKGGVLRLDNVQLLCRSCNSSKGNRTTEWSRTS